MEAEADRLVRATLRTLARWIGKDEADDLASELPHVLHDELLQGPPERFTVDAFVERVRDVTGGTDDEVRSHIRAVFSVIEAAASAGEIEDIRARLPDALHPLICPDDG